MAKKTELTQDTEEKEGFELIEMATADVELLTRAFYVISEICEELEKPRLSIDALPEKVTLH